MDPLHATIEEFAADGYTHVECFCPRCRMTRLRPISWLPRISMGLTIAQLSERLRCAECGGQLHSVKPWRMEDVLGKPLGVEGEVKNQRPPAANLSSASQSISVAVCVPAVSWGWQLSSRIVSLATGYPALSFSGIKRRTDANGIMPTGILDPLRDG